MTFAAIKRARFGLIGGITRDQIKLPSGKKREGLGGILYQAAALCGLGAEVIPIAVVGEEIWPNVLKSVRSWQGFKTEGISLVGGLGHQVFLEYPKKGERQERLRSAAPPLSSSRALPFLNGLDFLIVVFNSGFDLDFFTWRQVVETARCPRWLDIHSLVLSSNLGRRKYEAFPSWPAWVKGVDYLQANEKELACLLNHPRCLPREDELSSFAAECFSLGVKAVFITLGSRGLYLATQRKEKFLEPKKQARVADTTGCGDCFAAAAAWKLSRAASAEEAALFGLELAAKATGVCGVESIYRLVFRAFNLTPSI